MLQAIAALFIFQLLGEVLVQWLALPIPGPLIGMLLLFAALVARGAVLVEMAQTANLLLGHLMLLFIPAVAGVMMYFGRVGQEWLPFLVACLGGAAVTITVSALALRWMLGRRAAEGVE